MGEGGVVGGSGGENCVGVGDNVGCRGEKVRQRCDGRRRQARSW